jgi:hypothetical protein
VNCPEKPGEGSSPAPDGADAAFERGKKHLVLAMAVLSVGLAIAGAFDRLTGGVIVLAAWFFGGILLHRLGRAGSAR